MKTQRRRAEPDLRKALAMIDQARKEGRHPAQPAYRQCGVCRMLKPSDRCRRGIHGESVCFDCFPPQ